MSDTTTTAAETDTKAPFTPRVLSDFETKVFAVALDSKNQSGWCDEGFNQAMRKLDLPTKPATAYGHGSHIVVSVPTTGTVTYRLSAGSVSSEAEAIAAVANMVDSDRRSVANQNGLRYGTRSTVEFDTANPTVTGLPDGADHRTDEQKQWDAAMEQVKALKQSGTLAADLDTEDGDDEDDD